MCQRTSGLVCMSYREITLGELPAIADYLDRLPNTYDEILRNNWHM